ncbi:MAG: hypothetical protein EON96_20975 [Caulobacteraceae bacterium]|nr:MAG: hypothetical protein EON96_20975 [Caulobacteraceae bacterium]
MADGSFSLPIPAHAVRPFAAVPFDGRDDDAGAIDAVLAALRRTAAADFDMGATAVVSGPMIEGRVWVRTTDGTFTLSTVDAAVIALHIHLLPDMPAADRFADAFNLCATHAVDKVGALRRWGRA